MSGLAAVIKRKFKMTPEQFQRHLQLLEDSKAAKIRALVLDNNEQLLLASSLTQVKIDFDLTWREIAEAAQVAESSLKLFVSRKRTISPDARVRLSDFVAQFNAAQFE